MNGTGSVLATVSAWASGAFDATAGAVKEALLNPLSNVSFPTFLCALTIGLIYVVGHRLEMGADLSPRSILAALFPRRLVRSASTRMDIVYFSFNTFFFFAVFGVAVVSFGVIESWAQHLLSATFGRRAPAEPPPFIAITIGTATLFLVGELAYWIDHYLSHNVPFLWELHKVHHQATALSPLTNARMHPIDLLKFVNITTTFMAIGVAVATYLVLGSDHEPIAASPLFVVIPFYLFQHLQHSRFWIPFTGLLGRIFISPAHHQIHHSMDPRDFNSNLGQVLAIWDWMFGTLRIPQRQRQHLRFGVEGSVKPHSLYGALVAPVGRSIGAVAALRLGPARQGAEEAAKAGGA